MFHFEEWSFVQFLPDSLPLHLLNLHLTLHCELLRLSKGPVMRAVSPAACGKELSR